MSNLNQLTKDLTNERSHSLCARLENWAYMARMIDKGLATITGKSGEYHFACPADHLPGVELITREITNERKDI